MFSYDKQIDDQIVLYETGNDNKEHIPLFLASPLFAYTNNQHHQQMEVLVIHDNYRGDPCIRQTEIGLRKYLKILCSWYDLLLNRNMKDKKRKNNYDIYNTLK
jgi:hypothetical protein